MFNEPVIYVDIETSGGSPASAGIIEIGAIRVEDGAVVKTYQSFVNPGRPLPYWITNITGITDADVIQAPQFQDIACQLHNILSGAIFIAHNVRFDYSFIKKHMEAAGYTYKPTLLCTVRLSRALYPHAPGHSLEKILARHAIPVDKRHRAYDDAQAIKTFTELAHAERGNAAFQKAIPLQLKSQTLPPHLPQTDVQRLTNIPGVYIFEDEAGRPLYVGKSKQLRTRVLSHFTQDMKVTKELKISQQAYRLRTVQTGSELEALLLESKLVKELLPLHNRQLRRQSQCIVLLKEYEHGYARIRIEMMTSPPIDHLENIYGVYNSRAKAKASLEAKLRTFDLCSKLLGLEKTDRACFLHQLGKCRSGCIGKEPAESYNSRLDEAMRRSRIESWPYDGPISLYENEHTSLVVDKWVIIGRVTAYQGTHTLLPVQANFDMDTYRILWSYLNRRSYIAATSRTAKVPSRAVIRASECITNMRASRYE